MRKQIKSKQSIAVYLYYYYYLLVAFTTFSFSRFQNLDVIWRELIMLFEHAILKSFVKDIFIKMKEEGVWQCETAEAGC